MRRVSIILALAICTLFISSCNNNGTKIELKTFEDSVSYATGISLYEIYKNEETIVKFTDSAIVRAAFNTMVAGEEPMISEEEQADVLDKFFKKVESEKQKQKEALYHQMKVEGEEFLAQNAKREGVVTTESGLQYEVITQGKGKSPKATDFVQVHYEGTYISGDIFDSSYRRNKPAKFALNQVIAGWTEGLQLMNVGSKYKLYIPYNLAYGENGSAGNIPPYSTLIFTVELLDITEK